MKRKKVEYTEAPDNVSQAHEQLALYSEALDWDDTSRFKRNGAKEKVLGAVYTPPRVASALTRWAVRSADETVLDPSCGEGVFLAAARTRLADLGARRPNCTGVDIDGPTAELTGAVHSDFFAWAKKAPSFDVILGNPPFIRSHLFQEESRQLAFGGLAKLGLKAQRLMSTWAPFLAICSGMLNERGRLAMVIPEELLVVGYAEELRRFLLSKYHRVVVCFPASNIFPSVQQGVVLLMCEKEGRGKRGLFTMKYEDLEAGNHAAVKSANPWDWNDKWSHLFMAPKERDLINDLVPQLGWKPFSHYGRVSVGIVTGDNDFFVLKGDATKKFDKRHLRPIVTSARDLKGISFNGDDFDAVIRSDRPAYLLNITAPASLLSQREKDYLKHGVDSKVSMRYKCRGRSPWYGVPSVWEPHAIMLRQIGDMPKIVHMEKSCVATDTVHRVTWNDPSKGKQNSVGFMNTWTQLASEVMGRSYGGGVLELMPGEANQLPMPKPSSRLDRIFSEVDTLVRNKQADVAVEKIDAVVLPASLSTQDRVAMRSALDSLVERRRVKSA
jgi:adenine-specific DNA-methyltransferase